MVIPLLEISKSNEGNSEVKMFISALFVTENGKFKNREMVKSMMLY